MNDAFMTELDALLHLHADDLTEVQTGIDWMTALLVRHLAIVVQYHAEVMTSDLMMGVGHHLNVRALRHPLGLSETEILAVDAQRAPVQRLLRESRVVLLLH